MDVFINSGLFRHFWLLLHKKRTAPPFKRERSIIPPFLVLGVIYKNLAVFLMYIIDKLKTVKPVVRD